MFDRLSKKIIGREKKKGEIDVFLVNDSIIKKLNHKFRHKNKPTDVLAFSYGDENLLGDVIISKETAQRNAHRFGMPYRQELKRLVVHGILHVLGYNHGKGMRSAEKTYTQL